jgi:hypothetical protein
MDLMKFDEVDGGSVGDGFARRCGAQGGHGFAKRLVRRLSANL